MVNDFSGLWALFYCSCASDHLGNENTMLSGTDFEFFLITRDSTVTFFEDYTDRMKPYIAEWRKLGLHFDGICTGFLGSVEQISIVSEFFAGVWQKYREREKDDRTH